ncbi:paired amphipathic helix protein Sin3-like 3 [Rosa sericea]
MAAAEPFANPLQKQAVSEDIKNFMEKVKRGIGEEKYQSFLDVVGEYQDKQTSIHKLLEEMSVLLCVEPDLVKELNHLLPDGISKLEIERKVPKPKSRWLSGLRYVCVGGLGLTLGIWAHLLF